MSNTPYQALGAAIAAARTGAGMATQAELAARLDSRQQTVSRWEAGTHRPRAQQLPVLAAILKIGADKLRRLAGYDSLPVTPLVEPFPTDRLDPVSFELFTADVAAAAYPGSDVRRLGASGHKQDGGDVIVRDGARTILIQCKRTTQFGPSHVTAAVKAAQDAQADAYVLALSRVASPGAAEAVYKAGWTLWDRDDFSREIRKFPLETQKRLVDIYFPGHRQALLGLAEAGPWRTVEEFFRPWAAQEKTFSHAWPLLGRETDLAELEALLAAGQGRVTLLSAPGGMGKSRLLREIGEHAAAAHQTLVRFLVPNEELRSKDLEALGSGPKLLVVDDAHDRDGLGLLLTFAEQAENQTTLLLAARPYGIDRLRREAAVQGLEVQQHDLKRLTREQLLALARKVLADSGLPDLWAEAVVDAAGGSPLIVSMGARVVARDRLPPELAKQTTGMRDYILGKFADVLAGDLGEGRDPLRTQILSVLALVQPFHIDDRRLHDLIETLTGLKGEAARDAIAGLVEAGVAFQRAGRYRLMPDVLGDYQIETSCLSAGRLSHFAERALAVTPAALQTNLMVNLGRLDWRINDGDTSASTLLAEAWSRLDAIRDEWDDRLEAAKAVALYQPKQAIAFVERMVRSGRTLSALADILRNAAHTPAYFAAAAEGLWELGRHDDRHINPYPSHPIRVLTDLAAYYPNKPLLYAKETLALGERLVADPSQWTGTHTPLEVLRPLLALEGTTHRSDGRVIHMGAFFVTYDLVAPLRNRVTEIVLGLLTHEDPKIARLAAAELDHILRYPMGAYGARMPDGLDQILDREFVQTLGWIRALIPRLAFTTTLTIARQLRWLARRGPEAVALAAQDVLDAVTLGPDERLLLALETAHPLDLEFDYGDAHRRVVAAYLEDVAEETEQAFPDPDARLARIGQALESLAAAGLEMTSAHMLMNQLMRRDMALTERLVASALRQPEAPTARFAAQGLVYLLEPGGPPDALGYLRQAIDGPVALQAAAANALAARREPTADELTLLRKLLRSDTSAVVMAAARAVWGLRDTDPALALDLVLGANLGVDRKVRDDLMMGLHDERQAVGLPDAATAQRLLDRLEPLPDLQGYWTDKVLATLSETYPRETADFFLRRIARAGQDQKHRFRAANFGPYGHEPLRFIQSSLGPEIIARTWSWLRAAWNDDLTFAYRAGEAFEAMFLDDDGFVARFFDGQLAQMSASDLKLAARLLARASPSFIFSQVEFISRFMDRVMSQDPEQVDPIAHTLSDSSRSGVRSGLIGVPTAADEAERDGATAALARLPRFSPARAVYESALHHAQWSIDRAIRDGEAFEEA